MSILYSICMALHIVNGVRLDEMGDSAERRQMAQLQILYKARGRKLEELTNDLQILREDSSREIRCKI